MFLYHLLFTGNVFSKTEMSEVLTEIVKADPNFDKERFIREVQHDIIPNILEVSLTFCCIQKHI